MIPYQLLKNIFALKHNLKLTKEELNKRNLLRFREMVRYVQKHSPYYEKIIKENKIDINNCTPDDFPILTKESFIKNFNEIVTDPNITKDNLVKFLENSHNTRDLFLNKFHVLHTSGTSGQIGYFVYSKKDWAKGFSQSIRIHKLGLRKKLAYVAVTGGHFAGVSLVDFGNRSMNKLFYNIKTFDINKPFLEIIKELNTFQPDIIAGYAMALKILANAKEKGELLITPSILESGGEPLLSEDKNYIERVFGKPVINVYASSEHLIMGIGKSEYDGMYLMEDDLIFEFHSDKVCVTNLFNWTTPLIRYKMNDILIPKKDIKPIFPFIKVKDIVGRSEHAPLFINRERKEDFIHPIVFVEFFVRNLDRFQIQIIDKHSFKFRVLLNENLSKQESKETIQQIKDKLKNILIKKNMDNVRFDIIQVNRLDVDPKTGKFRLVVK